MMASSTYVRWLTILGAAIVAVATPLKTGSEYRVKEHHNVSPKWSRIGDAPSNHIINLQIGLRQGRFAELERHLYQGRKAWVYFYSCPVIDKFSRCSVRSSS
jgi:hypothetical protein